MTIYDIAKAAGVSASTVSRVINNKKGINENTRKKVQQILLENNFTLNEAARGLSIQSTKTIGILLEDIRVSHHTESVYLIEQEMTNLGFTCITFSTGRSVEHKVRCIKILEQRRVDGVILMGSMFATKEVENSIKSCLAKVPVVISNGYIDLPNVYGVLVDEEQGVQQCVEYLVRKNCKKIAYVKNDTTPSENNKLNGFFSGMEKYGEVKANALIYDASSPDSDPVYTVERGRLITEQMMREHPDLDGIIYSVDLLAIGGLKKLSEMSVDVPGQVSVVGIDNTLYGKISTPTLTTLNNKLVETSRNAARILLDALEEREVSHKIMLFTDIIEREST